MRERNFDQAIVQECQDCGECDRRGTGFAGSALGHAILLSSRACSQRRWSRPVRVRSSWPLQKWPLQNGLFRNEGVRGARSNPWPAPLAETVSLEASAARQFRPQINNAIHPKRPRASRCASQEFSRAATPDATAPEECRAADAMVRAPANLSSETVGPLYLGPACHEILLARAPASEIATALEDPNHGTQHRGAGARS